MVNGESEMTLTQVLAMWGAILSSVITILNIARWVQDRYRLKVEGMIGKFHGIGTLPAKPPKGTQFLITVTNIGRRPIMVQGIGFVISKNDQGALVAVGLPKMLKEGEYHMEWTDDFEMLSEKVKNIFAWDSAGRKWKMGRRNLRRLKAQAVEQETK
jgi:hypothetical protein